MSFYTTIQENLVVITGAGSSIITGLLAWLATRKKDKKEEKISETEALRSEFTLLMNANAEFRIEIRKDLELAKQELANAKARITLLESELRDRAEKILHLEHTIALLSK